MFLTISIIFLLPIYLIKLYLSYKYQQIRQKFTLLNDENSKLIAFFHPFCNAGGGGERVLWSAIKSLHREFPQHCFVIYSDKYDVESMTIVRKANEIFKLDLNVNENSLKFVQLNTCWLLLAKYYPVATLLGQNIGSFIVGVEALFRCPPDIYIDTIGASFTYPLFRLIGSAKVATYTHYPIISTDMLQVVADNRDTFNNRAFIAQSRLLTAIKIVYYRIFVFVYRIVSKGANVVMVNSTWTKNHIEQLWHRKVAIVYPPCNVDNLCGLSLDGRNPNMIISLSQFRPEKNHELQLQSIHKLMEILKENNSSVKPLLIMIGSCRNEEDENLAENLRRKSIKLGIGDCIKFCKNIAYEKMINLMKEASIAIHTMTNEHFGISVVEFLAAGLLTIAHNSGGPKLDIITENETGFLAEDCDQFAHYLYKLMTMSDDEKRKIQTKARESTARFSQQKFEQSFLQQMSSLF